MNSIFPFTVLFSQVFVALNNAQDINYFGVAYSPYVDNGPPFPYWNSYTIDNIKQMLSIILQGQHNAVSTYGMGVASYNNGQPWDQCDSSCLIARAASEINQQYNSVVLSVSQGIYQHDEGDLMQREIDNAFSAAQDANSRFPGTVWGLTFTNEYVNIDGNRVLQMILANKDRAHQQGLKIGTRVRGDTCAQIWGGPLQSVLIQIAQQSDFIMCNFYPPNGANNANDAVQQISNSYYSARDGFWRYNGGIEVQIGETGWASQGQTFNNAVNTVENEKDFWDGMRSWSQSNSVKVQMFEAFDEPWKDGDDGEKHFGWWYKPDNNQNVYIEKATGQVYQ